MSVSKWMAEMRKMDGAVNERVNPHDRVIKTKSPSVNFMFGNSWGLPEGYSLLVSGPPKGGKSLVTNLLIGGLHQAGPESIAIKFDTEFRTKGQLRPESAQGFGIDMDRLLEVEANSAQTVFDEIETGRVRKALEGGAKIKLVAIDSVNGVMGTKMENADSVAQHLVGDMAQTLQNGLKRILPIQRKYGFAVVLVAQARAEMDANKVKYEHKVWKPAVSWAVLHHCEYFMEIDRSKSKDGKTDLLGNEFVNDDMTDMAGKGEKTGHKIRAVMSDSSMGPKGRTAEFTLDYYKGLINIHEEVALLSINRGIVAQAGAWCSYGDRKWNGVKAFVKDLSEDMALQTKLVNELETRDRTRTLGAPIFEIPRPDSAMPVELA